MTYTHCITFCHRDIHYWVHHFEHLKKQTKAPDKILISTTGVSHRLSYIPKTINIQNKDIEVSIISTEEGHRPGFARNQGLDNCKTDIISFFDGDNDYIHPQRTELYFKAFEENNIDILASNYTYQEKNFELYDSVGELYRINDIVGGTVHVRCPFVIATGPLGVRMQTVVREKNIRYNVNEACGEDGMFCQAALWAGLNVYGINRKLFCYKCKDMS